VRYVALYCRLSPRPDGSYEGVDVQEQWGRAYAAKTWPGKPIEVFADRGISAANGDRRPEYERLREWIRDGRIEHVWAVEQQRLERREIGWFELAAELDAAGITELHTNRDGIVRVYDDVSGIKAVLAAGEVRRLKRRIRDMLAAKAAAGRPPGAQPFGYRHGIDEDGQSTLVPHPEEAAAVKEAAARILSGWSQANVVKDLTARGFTGRRGGPLTPGKLRKILTNPTVAGFRVHEGKLVRGVWEPLLDEQTWRAVRRKLENPRVVVRSDGKGHPITPAGLRPRNARKYILTGGLTVCGKCETPLVGTRKKDTKSGTFRPELLCSPLRGGCGGISILMEPTEQHVVDELMQALDTPEFREAMTADEHAERREAALRKLEAIEQQREELAQMWGAGQLSAGEWQAARERLLERESQARHELADIPPPVRADLEGVREAWPAMTLDERRELLRLIIEKITIHPSKKRGVGPFDHSRIKIKWWA